jgi:hypothetical protein
MRRVFVRMESPRLFVYRKFHLERHSKARSTGLLARSFVPCAGASPPHSGQGQDFF